MYELYDSYVMWKEVSRLTDDKRLCNDHEFFGSVTVGERGQVVIPAEARKKMGIQPGDKLLVMGHPFAQGVVLASIDSMREALSAFLEGLTGIEQVNAVVNDHIVEK